MSRSIKFDPSEKAAFVAGAGKPLGHGQALAEFEAEIAKIRAMGAPDDAVVSRAVPGSIDAVEVAWVGPAGRLP